MFSLPTLRPYGGHARTWGRTHTVAAITARLADERTAARLNADYHASVARQAAVRAAMDAPTIELPIVIDAEIVDPWQDPAIAIAADPEPTLPLLRAQLFGQVEAMGGAR